MLMALAKLASLYKKIYFHLRCIKKKLIHAFRCGLSYDAFGKFREHT